MTRSHVRYKTLQENQAFFVKNNNQWDIFK